MLVVRVFPIRINSYEGDGKFRPIFVSDLNCRQVNLSVCLVLVKFTLAFVVNSFNISVDARGVYQRELVLTRLVVRVRVRDEDGVPALTNSMGEVHELSEFEGPRLVQYVELVTRVHNGHYLRCVWYEVDRVVLRLRYVVVVSDYPVRSFSECLVLEAVV